MHQPPNVTSGIHELSAKTYIKESIEHPIVTMGIPCKKNIKCSQIHKSIQSDSETSKVKLNSSQEDRREKHHMIRL